MTSPTLSVALCTYQGEAFLRKQLESLLAQTRIPDEIVIGDDASTDATWNILQAFVPIAQARGVSVKIARHGANVGFVRNFSETLQSATGDIVLLCDQDDVWQPSKLAAMEEAFKKNASLTLMCSDARLIDAQDRDLHCLLFDALELRPGERQAIRDGDAFEVLLRRSMATGATVALRRELIDMALPVGDGWIHDEWLAVVASAVGRMDMLEQALIDYRQHTANQIGMRRRTLMDKWRDMVRPRGQQMRTEVDRLRVLSKFLKTLGSRVPSTYLQQIEHKQEHFKCRAEIGQIPRYKRLVVVWGEARRGGYQQYGTGPRSMLRDLLRHD